MKKFVSMLLALLMLIALLPMNATAEEAEHGTSAPVANEAEPTAEPVAESTEEPVAESADEPTTEPAEDPAEEPAKRTAETDGTVVDSGTTGFCTWTLTGEEDNYTLTISGECAIISYDVIPYDYMGQIVNVIIEDSVVRIENWTFESCNSLTTITIGEGVTSIGDYAFYCCASLSEINVNENNANYASLDGVLFNKDMTTLICYPAGKAEATYSVPEGVTSIGDYAFEYCSALTSITIPDSVTNIGDYAFEYCSALTSITIPDSVTNIGDYAFEYCSALTSITIPDGVTSIGSGAFEYCTSLTSITIPDSVTSIGNYAFRDCTSLTSITIGNSVTNIGDYAFSDCDSLISITIPASVTEIGTYAFWGCTALVEIAVDANNTVYSSVDGVLFSKDGTTLHRCPQGKTGAYSIPDGVMSIGSDAFRDCTSLTSITMPDSVTSIGRIAFMNCTSLRSISFGKGLREINERAFYSCDALEKVHISDLAGWCNLSMYAIRHYEYDEVVEIWNPLLYAHNLYLGDELITDLVIPDGVTEIKDYAFIECTSIQTITISYNVTSIGASAFRNCGAVTDIYYEGCSGQWQNVATNVIGSLPDAMIHILWDEAGFIYEDGTLILGADFADSETYAWSEYADEVTEIIVLNGVTKIPSNAFDGFSALESIEISADVVEIGEDAFASCDKLTTVYYFGSEEAWNEIDYSFPESVSDHWGCVLASDDWYIMDGILTITKNFAWPNKSYSSPWRNYADSIQRVALEEGVTSIGSFAFNDCSSLTSITIPDSVTSIGDFAFSGCSSLTTVTLPNSVTSVGDAAFEYCTSLTSVMLPDSVTSIGDSVFYDCTSLTSVMLPEGLESIGYRAFQSCSSLTSITLPDSVTSIGESAFSNCTSLTSIEIPDSVAIIGESAFSNCTSLTSVTIGEGVTTIGDSAFSDCDFSEVHYNASNCTNIGSSVLSDVSFCNIYIGNSVDSFPYALISSIYLNTTNVLIFEGPNHFTADQDYEGLRLNAPLDALEAGTYYVDESGALYRLEENHAVFVYCPDGLTQYTIAKTVPTENGNGSVNVTRIGTHVLYQADALISLTIESPEQLTSIASYAFAECPTLTSVVLGVGEGKIVLTNKADVLAKLANSQLGIQLFVNTGLLGEETLQSITVPIVIESANGEELVKISGNSDSFDLLTGESAEIQVSLSAPTNVAEELKPVRIYILFDRPGLALGNRVDSGIEIVSGLGNTYKVKVGKSAVYDNAYFYEFSSLVPGDTLNYTISLAYPSGTTGGTALVWPTQVETTDGSEVYQSISIHHRYTWGTKEKTFTSTHALDTLRFVPLQNPTEGVFAALHKFNAVTNFRRTSNEGNGDLGADYVKRVSYQQVITLPEGLRFKHGVGRGDISNDYYSELIIRSVKRLDDRTLIVEWYVNNAGFGEIAENYHYITINTGSVLLEQPEEGADLTGKQFTIASELTQTVYYTFAEPKTEEPVVAIQTVTVGAANPIFSIEEQESYQSADYGYSYPLDIFIKNYGVLPAELLDASYAAELTDLLYIPAEQLQQMFDVDTEKQLAVTIENATLCKAISEDGTITVTDAKGDKIQVGINRVGLDSIYIGDDFAECSARVVDEAATLKLYWNEQGKLMLSVTVGNMTQDFDADGRIESLLNCMELTLNDTVQMVSYAVTAHSAYTLEWKLGDLTLNFWTDVRHEIPSYVKDTFMLLQADTRSHRLPEEEALTPSEGEATWLEGSQTATKKSTTADYVDEWTYNYTYEIRTVGDRYLYGDIVLDPTVTPLYNCNETDNAGNLIVIQEDTVIRHDIRVDSSNYAYTYLPSTPVIAVLSAAQTVLVPINENPQLSESGLEKKTFEETEYYLLSKPGIYHDVKMMDGTVADTIEVTADAEAGYVVMVKWYYAEAFDTYSVPVLLDRDLCETVQLDAWYWLNDHITHRLNDYIPMGQVFVPYVRSDLEKKIVMTRGESPLQDDVETYSEIYGGDTVTYRLNIHRGGITAYTLDHTTVYDELPPSTANHRWSKDNVTVEFLDSEGNTIAGSDLWEISDTDPNENGKENQQYLIWKEGFEIRFADAPASDDVYIYVTLTYPETETAAWQELCEVNLNGVITNRFHSDHKDSTVYHDLKAESSMRLQKGVVEVEESDSLYYYSNGKNENGHPSIVYFYTLLYNDGDARLFLNDIYDLLPRGFDFGNVISYKSASLATYDATGTRKYLSFKDKNVYIDEPTVDEVGGRQLVRFEFRTSEWDSNPLRYDDYHKAYYLLPGEAIEFIYYSNVDTTFENADDFATNTIAMPLHPYNADLVSIIEHTATNTNGKGNDGNCELRDNSFATNLGMAEQYGNATNQTVWAMSDVTLERGMIVPGITKKLISATSPTGIVTENPIVANAADTLTWEITATNNHHQEMRNYAITDVMQKPYTYTGALITREYHVNSYSWNIQDEVLLTFGETQYDEDGNVTAIETDQGLLEVNGDSVGGTYDAKVSLKTDAYGNLMLSVYFDHFHDEIPQMGKRTLLVSTAPGTTFENKVFFNTCYITPMQSFEQIGDGYRASSPTLPGHPAVTNRAQVAITYGYATSSYKEVTASSLSSNKASTLDGDQEYIVLGFLADGSKYDTFRYDLGVINSTPNSLDQLVIIDNLPEPNDHSTFDEFVQRYSEFKVGFADDPNVTVKVKTANGSVTTLRKDQYALAFSTKTSFEADDWTGTAEGWNVWNASNDYRSLRVLIEDPNGILIPKNATVIVSFDAQIEGDPQTGATAWNSFGYRYSITGDNSILSATPQNVGVLIPGIPTLQKKLLDLGETFVADADKEYRFLIYEGSMMNLQNMTDEEIAKALKNANREFTVVTVTVPKDASESPVLALDKLFAYEYQNGWEATGAEWIWENGKSYTVFELPINERGWYCDSFNNAQKTSHTFTYDERENQSIVCANEYREWEILVQKTDQYGRTLQGIFFGLYSPIEGEALTQEQIADFELTEEIPETLVENGITYYLKAIAATDTNGEILWTGLHEERYCVLELHAPEQYTMDETVYTPLRPVSGKGGVRILVVNNVELTPTDISFDGKKVINGNRTIHAGEFLFELYETDADCGVTAEPIRTAKVDGAGGFTFESITLEMPGTYYYVIRENADDPIENMEYDKGEYRITVTVSDDGQGNLQIESESILRVDGEIEEAADEIIFENIYYVPEPPPKTGDPTKLGLWLALLAISSVSLATLALCRRRRQDIV